MRGPAGLPAGLRLPRPLVMGVLNVTPDSFSDGGDWLEPESAVARGLTLVAAGADLVDVGGESTRPGAARVPAPEELDRVLAVVEGLSAAGVAVSVDTMRAEVAARAVGAGAVVVNDVSGGLADPDMYTAVAELGTPYVVMHWRAHSARMQQSARYGDVVADVRAELQARVDAAVVAGVPADRLVLDPGLGFAKDAEHNWALLAHLDSLRALGCPLLVGASRKRFLGSLLAEPGSARSDGGEVAGSNRGDDGAAEPDPVPRPPRERDAATAAVSALAAAAGVWCVRVHEPAASRDAVLVGAAWRAARGGT